MKEAFLVLTFYCLLGRTATKKSEGGGGAADIKRFLLVCERRDFSLSLQWCLPICTRVRHQGTQHHSCSLPHRGQGENGPSVGRTALERSEIGRPMHACTVLCTAFKCRQKRPPPPSPPRPSPLLDSRRSQAFFYCRKGATAVRIAIAIKAQEEHLILRIECGCL